MLPPVILALGLLFGAWAGGLARALPPQQAATPTPGGTVGLPQGGDGSAVPGQVLVRFRTSPSNAAQQPSQATNILRTAGIQSSVRRSLQTPGVYLLNVPSGSESAAVAALAARPDVQTADPNLTRHIHMRPAAPSDPLYPMQWGFARVNAPAAWNAAQLYNVTVAVLDTGLDLGHPEFAARTVEGANFVNPGSPPQDDNGHGTHVAGTIAENTGNGVGVTGLAYGVDLMPVRVLHSDGSGDSFTVARGIDYAVRHGADIVNLSLEFPVDLGPGDVPEVVSAVRRARRKGVLVVGAAGNIDPRAPRAIAVSEPARDASVLSVGATTDHRCIAYYSQHGSGLDLVAPGGGRDARRRGDPNCHPGRHQRPIYQLTFRSCAENPKPCGPGSFFLPGSYIGTSMATPHVSGVAALVIASGVLGRHPSPAAIFHRLERTADPLGPRGYDRTYGAGLVDAGRATSSG